MCFFSRMRSEKGNFATFNPKRNPNPAKNTKNHVLSKEKNVFQVADYL